MHTDTKRRLIPDPKLSLTNESPWAVFGESAADAPHSTYNLVSLFSGCGGVDLGFHFAGFRTLWANDISADAAETFTKNLGKISVGDIRSTQWPVPDSKVDVLAAGFPCQPFSNAGSRLGLEDDRGTLFYDALRAVKHFSPEVVLFENVRGILSFKINGVPLVKVIGDALQNLGYDAAFKLVDASAHRVGQRRLRLIIVGARNGAKPAAMFPGTHPDDGLAIGEMLNGLEGSSPNQNELMPLNPQAVMLGKHVPEGGSWKNIPYEFLPDRLKRIRDDIKRYRWPNFYRRFHRDEIAGTVTAAFKPENAAVWHPVHGGVLSVREVARIQSFPDWFEFKGRSIQERYKQIGNAVPPRLAYEFASTIAKVLADPTTPSGSVLSFEAFEALGRPYRPSDPAVVL
jgi:DNA (cytosine-5)-methyltransferase 1